MTPDVGDVYWTGNNIEIDVRGNISSGTRVTVTYTYTQNGTVYTGTIIVTVTR